MKFLIKEDLKENNFFAWLRVLFFPKKGDDGPKSTSKIIAIAINNKPKSMISLNICLILEIIF